MSLFAKVNEIILAQQISKTQLTIKFLEQMKKNFRNHFFVLPLVAGAMALISSCGTIASGITGGKRPSFLMNAPADVQVKLNGEVQDIKSELFASNVTGSSTVDYYGWAIKIPYKQPVTLEISSSSLGKTGTVELTPKSSSAIFWGNVFICPIAGHILDAVTKNNKMLRPKYIDVVSVLNNVPQKDWPSQSKLKARAKKGAK